MFEPSSADDAAPLLPLAILLIVLLTFVLVHVWTAPRAQAQTLDEPAIELAVGVVEETHDAADIPRAARRALDLAIEEALRAQGFTRVVYARSAFEDFSLAAGCRVAGTTFVTCLDRMNVALHTDALIVTRMRLMEDDVSITLVYRDPSSRDAPSHATLRTTQSEASRRMGALVAELFGAPRVRSTRARPTPPLTWATVAGGAALTITGAALHVSALSGDHTSLHATSTSDVDEIERSLQAARTRALVGDVLMGVGAVSLVIGWIAYLTRGTETETPEPSGDWELGFAPTAHGGSVTMRGAL